MTNESDKEGELVLGFLVWAGLAGIEVPSSLWDSWHR